MAPSSSILRDRFRSPVWQFSLRRIAPLVLFLATVSMVLARGVSLFGGGTPDWLFSTWRAALFTVSLLFALGAHAVGHYLAARRNSIDAYPPYFVPALTMLGTVGAFVKLTWPIEDRKALVQIFTAGSIAGFAVSTALLLAGLALSEVTPRPTFTAIEFGDSLLTFGAQRVMFPELTENETLMPHPVGLAGWLGLFFNLWHLFPAGRLDGGRLIYALWGYRVTLAISWLTIVVLGALGILWAGWLTIALFAGLTMVRLRNQYPVEKHEQSLDPGSVRLVWVSLLVLILIFVPVPVRLRP